MMRRTSVLIAVAAFAASGRPVEFMHITDTHVMQIEGIHPILVPQKQANLPSAF